VVANFAAASFRTADVEAVGTVLWSWIGGRPAKVLGVNRGTVVPRTGRFEITVGVDTWMISEMDDE